MPLPVLSRRVGATLLCLVTALPVVTTTAGADEQPSSAPPQKAEAKQPDTAIKLPPGVKMERDLAYIQDGDEAQKLDLYLPVQPPAKPLPLVVHIHGGGWRGGSKLPCPTVHMVGLGYVVASVEYRFSQKAKFPAQIQDCQAAIRWLRANSAKYGIDPVRVGVVGGSAGGHLSALVGTAGGRQAFPAIGDCTEQSDRVQAVCDIFGPANFSTVMRQAADDKNVRNIYTFNAPDDPYSCLIGSALDGDRGKADAASPIHYVSQDSPPTLILHGTHDALVPYAQSVEFAAALEGRGVPVFLQTLPGSGHGGPAFGRPAVIGLMSGFFDKFLKGTEAPFAIVPEADLAVDPPK